MSDKVNAIIKACRELSAIEVTEVLKEIPKLLVDTKAKETCPSSFVQLRHVDVVETALKGGKAWYVASGYGDDAFSDADLKCGLEVNLETYDEEDSDDDDDDDDDDESCIASEVMAAAMDDEIFVNISDDIQGYWGVTFPVKKKSKELFVFSDSVQVRLYKAKE